jgi:hypothetical protein
MVVKNINDYTGIFEISRLETARARVHNLMPVNKSIYVSMQHNTGPDIFGIFQVVASFYPVPEKIPDLYFVVLA